MNHICIIKKNLNHAVYFAPFLLFMMYEYDEQNVLLRDMILLLAFDNISFLKVFNKNNYKSL